MSGPVLVAGIGNIFLSDDGFGVEVARRLAGEALPEGVEVADFGIRGLHLAYDLLDGGYETTILVDALPRGGEPGTVYLLEPDPADLEGATPLLADAHGMAPLQVFAHLEALGGRPGKLLVVGCEPASTDEGIGLTPPVERAVGEAVRLIRRLVGRADRKGAGAVVG